MAANPGGFHSIPNLRSTAVGDEGVCHRYHSRLPGRAHFGVGVRSDARGNQALGRSSPDRVNHTQGRHQVDGDHRRRGGPRNCPAPVPIYSDAKIVSERADETKRFDSSAGQVGRSNAFRKSQFRQGERVFRPGYPG